MTGTGDPRDDYQALLKSGWVMVEVYDADFDRDAWRREIRRLCRADRIKVRTDVLEPEQNGRQRACWGLYATLPDFEEPEEPEGPEEPKGPPTVGFTGSEAGMTDEQQAAVRQLLSRFKQLGAEEFKHGGWVGADTQAARMAASFGYRTVCWLGRDPARHGDFVSDVMHRYPPWGEGREADEMYNDLLAEDCDLLIATPERGSRTSDVVRSAPRWTTVYVVQPDGRIHRERMEMRFTRRFVEDIDPSKERLDFEGPYDLDDVLDKILFPREDD